MAKTTTKKATPPAKPAAKRQEVAESNVDLMLLMRQDAGLGTSTAPEDNTIPLIYILQSGSPQVLKAKPADYIKGATAGNIWLRGTKTLIDGDEGMQVILAATRKFWVEWGPERGSGLQGKHDWIDSDPDRGRPDDAERVNDPKTGMAKWVRSSNDNVLVETMEHAVLVNVDGQWSPYVISMKSTDLSQCARNWNTDRMRRRFEPPNDDFIPPAYAFVYTMKTIAKGNDRGDWYGWAWEHGTGDGEVTKTTSLPNGTALSQMARQFAHAFLTGVKTAESEGDDYDNKDNKDNSDSDSDI